MTVSSMATYPCLKYPFSHAAGRVYPTLPDVQVAKTDDSFLGSCMRGHAAQKNRREVGPTQHSPNHVRTTVLLGICNWSTGMLARMWKIARMGMTKESYVIHES